MGFIIKTVKSVAKAVVGVVTKVVGGVFGFLIGGKKKAEASKVNTLNKQLNPEAYRKIVFGRTAAPLDLVYWEVWGSKGQNFDENIAVACHRVEGFRELYIDNELAISAAGIVSSKYQGVLSRDYRRGFPNQTAILTGSGTQWNASSTFDGCSYFKLSWIVDEKRLPSGIPSRYTQVIDGAPVYDPRRDSTMGGSGNHRWFDNSTWEYAALDSNGQPIGRNNALQVLFYLLGWYVNSHRVAGMGVLAEDINFASFIAGANACEAAGYYTDLVLSTGDSHDANLDKITADGIISRVIDPGGFWSYYANVDDTANVAVELTDKDVLAGSVVTWNEYKGMADQFNQVGGKFINPSSITLYQPFAYPLVRDTTYEENLGVKRRKTVDFEQVLDSTLAQRLARLVLNLGQYQGEHSAAWNYRALKAQAWSVVRYQSDRFGWTKLFRVWRYDLTPTGGVGLLLREIHPSIWTAGSVTVAPPPAAGINFDPRRQYSAENVVLHQATVTGGDGTIVDGFRIAWDAPPEPVRRTEIRYRVLGSSFWETIAPVERGTTPDVLIAPALPFTAYEAYVRHISIYEIAGPWVGHSGFTTLGNGNVNFNTVTAAGQSAQWSKIANDNGFRPENGATRNEQATNLLKNALTLSDAITSGGATLETRRGRVAFGFVTGSSKTAYWCAAPGVPVNSGQRYWIQRKVDIDVPNNSLIDCSYRCYDALGNYLFDLNVPNTGISGAVSGQHTAGNWTNPIPEGVRYIQPYDVLLQNNIVNGTFWTYDHFVTTSQIEATRGAPNGTTVGDYVDASSLAPAILMASGTADWGGAWAASPRDKLGGVQDNATRGAPSGTAVGDYADAASLAPAILMASATASWDGAWATGPRNKLGGVEDNATKGAPTGTLVAGIPAETVAQYTVAGQPYSIPINFGTSESIYKKVPPNLELFLTATVTIVESAGSNVVYTLAVEWRPAGGTWETVPGAVDVIAGMANTFVLVADGSVANNNETRLLEFRAVLSRSENSSGLVYQPTSTLTV